MENSPSNRNKTLLYILNLTLSIVGTLVILWFAFGVEQKNSRVQIIFEGLLKHSTPIIIGLIGLMVLLLVGSYLGMKSLKKGSKEP